jgi:uncharacterized membrane protein
MRQLFTLLITFIALKATAQVTGNIAGTVKDKATQSPLKDVVLNLTGTDFTTQTNDAGEYNFNVPTGTYKVAASRVGYASETQFNIIVTSGATQYVSFELSKANASVGEVSVKGTRSRKNSAVVADLITPLSTQRLTVTEIKNNPGGNFDISRVIQALPGVAGSTGSGGFRNDIIIRGGAPNENVFYLDGIEVPVINHFQTQGSSGGPQGQLNVSFIEDVKLSTSAFDARYDNTLASVFAFKQRNGNSKKFNGNVRLSGTELSITTEGPLTKNTTFMASARRSYLQALFALIDLPIRPNYWDFQWKTNTKINNKLSLITLGTGAIDEFSVVTSKNSTPENEYTTLRVPFIDGWNYTNGVALKGLVQDGYWNIALSRNMFTNRNRRWSDKNNKIDQNLNLNINSQEIENKLRFDYNKVSGAWRWSAGFSGQYVKFDNKFFALTTINNIPNIPITSNTYLDFFKFGAFGQIARKFFNDKLGWSAGLRTDMNTFTDKGMNPLRTLSPRTSVSYAIAPKWQASASVGTYYKIPIYTILGFKDAAGNFANKDLDYTRSTHYTAGVEFLPKESFRATAEVFYKRYSDYPVDEFRGISSANEGTGFVAVGNNNVSSTGLGRAYGFELFLQQKLMKRIFATASYTFVRSEFSGNFANATYFPSAWDYRHLFSGIVGYKLPRNWELGAKLRLSGGAPYTPFDTVASRAFFASNFEGTLDYANLNSQRLATFTQFDVRATKRWNFNRWSLDLFFDLTNASIRKNESAPTYVFKRKDDNSDWLTTDGQALKADGSNGIPVIAIDASAIPTPTLGFIVEW